VGSVVDQTGAALPGVRLTIRGVADRTADTGAAGDFAFPDLREGDYEISSELSGFERQARAVRVRAGERVTVSFTLRVALVEKTIVTAAKAGGRDVQETPIAISAVSQADLGRLGTRTIEGAPALAPSVTFSQNTGWGQLTIRGIGTNLLLAGSDPSSAIYLDGVYLAGGRSARTPETSRTRTTSREPSVRRPRHLPDVLDLRVNSLLNSPSGDKTVTLLNDSSAIARVPSASAEHMAAASWRVRVGTCQ
jgi:hypothetical protein